MPFQPESPELRNYIGLIEASVGFDKVEHPLYPETVEHAVHMAVHTLPDPKMHNPKTREMIDDRRPNEDAAVRDHRVKNYRQKTLSQYKKIKNTLEKVFNPKLSAIKYPEMPRGITSTLELYLGALPTGKAGKTQSLEQYTRNTTFESMLRDANGVTAIIPRPDSLEGCTDFIEPIPVFFSSKQVIDVGKDYYLLLTHMESPAVQGGAVLFLIDSEYIHLIVQTVKGPKRKFMAEVYYRHGLEEVPVVPMDGDEEEIEGDPIKYSYISGILPAFDEALVLYSDYRAVTVRIAYPIPWTMKTRCRACGGRKQVATKAMGGGLKECRICNGTGVRTAYGPADGIQVDPKDMAEGKIPNPPGGFIQPNSFARELREDIDKEINEGLSAIGMDHLRKDTNIQESGIAKRVGREDLNTFMDVIAQAIYHIQEEMARFIAAMRYGPAGVRPEEIVPVIERPTEYDLLSTGDHIARVGAAVQNGVSPTITQKMELDLMAKEYGDDSGVFLMAKAIHNLDPLPNLTPEQAMLVDPFTRDEDTFVHFNISRFVKRAVDENPAFFTLTRPAQLAIIYGYAEAEMEEMQPNIPPVEPVIES